jgi:serine/threonine protein kinase
MARALGRYELLRPLARGGMAEVYLARRRAAGVEKWLVVKRMRPERAGDARFLDLFVREARLSMSLAHQNIVPVFDFGRIDDQVFLAMERVEGKDLGSSLSRAKVHRLPPLLAAFIAAECCQALDYAHQRKSPEGIALGIVHRDVTPRNVLLSWSGEVKLTDFGIAALAGDATSRLLGTPQYMAPEQARSEPIDPRADIYAIGLVLREAVSGTRPRPGSDRETILDAARRGELLPWPHLTPVAPVGPEAAPGAVGRGPPAEPPPDDPDDQDDPPAALVAIIDRATAALPGDRYPDARSMLAELDSFIVGERAAHKVESPARQLAAWLASIWEDARDDLETGATVDAEHLVSFLDDGADGAFDVIGTGTIRSLAATAADDVSASPDGPSLPSSSTAPAEHGIPTTSSRPSSTSAAPPLATMTLAASSARSTGPAMRRGRISSSNTTVASGSFHTIPTPDVHLAIDRPPGAAARRRRARQIPPLVSLLFVSVAAGAVVFLLANDDRERDRPSTANPTAGQPIRYAPSVGQPKTGQPKTGQPKTGQPKTGQPKTEQPKTRQPSTRQLNRQLNTGQPTARQPHTRQPNSGHPGSGQPDPGAGADGSGTTATMPGEGDHRARPAMCRVRINLTPWAYYSAEDGIRRETPSTIELTPGPHRIHVWNPELHIERDITIHVPADRDTLTYSEPLQPPAPFPDAGPSHEP